MYLEHHLKANVTHSHLLDLGKCELHFIHPSTPKPHGHPRIMQWINSDGTGPSPKRYVMHVISFYNITCILYVYSCSYSRFLYKYPRFSVFKTTPSFSEDGMLFHRLQAALLGKPSDFVDALGLVRRCHCESMAILLGG